MIIFTIPKKKSNRNDPSAIIKHTWVSRQEKTHLAVIGVNREIDQEKKLESPMYRSYLCQYFKKKCNTKLIRTALISTIRVINKIYLNIYPPFTLITILITETYLL
jgi:hypothetical protein